MFQVLSNVCNIPYFLPPPSSSWSMMVHFTPEVQVVRVYVEVIKMWKSRVASTGFFSRRKTILSHVNVITFTFGYQVSNTADHMRCCDSYDASYTRVKRLYEPSKSTCDNSMLQNITSKAHYKWNDLFIEHRKLFIKKYNLCLWSGQFTWWDSFDDRNDWTMNETVYTMEY